MRKLALFVVLVCAVSVQAQTFKTAEGRKLQTVEKEITKIERVIAETTKIAEKMRGLYFEDSPEIAQIKQKLESQNKVLLALNVEKNSLLAKQLTKPLPNNNIELLKLIVVQNEKIIDLLEKLADQ